ncbi:MAG: hypothetical protein QNJ97_04560 [Myxococcota bacterium]|nr:hypothetical protein [Myxococcota bacterium]
MPGDCAKTLPVIPSSKTIICCDETFKRQGLEIALEIGGLKDIELVDANYFELFVESGVASQLVLICSNDHVIMGRGPFIARYLRSAGYDEAIAIVTSAPSIREIYGAFKAGVDDYLINGKKLDIGKEASGLIERAARHCEEGEWQNQVVSELGLFRTAGLTPGQIEMLVAFSKAFDLQADLAKKMGKTENQVRKTFSRIYKKLGPLLGIQNSTQLAGLLTVCIAGAKGPIVN